MTNEAQMNPLLSELASFITILEAQPAEQLSKVQLQIFLLNLLQRLYDMLSDTQNNTMVTALITRQLLELLIVARYVGSSEARAVDFVTRFHKDAYDMDAASIHWQENLSARLNEPSGLTQRKAELEARKQAIANGNHPTSAFMASRVAKDVGLQDEYEAVHKMCSKLLHCTPLLVIQPRNDYFFNSEKFRHSLVVAGRDYANSAFIAMGTTVRELLAA